MTHPHVEDPLESADNPQVGPPVYYGQLTVDAWFCRLERGRGKVPHDPTQDSLDGRRTAIKLSVTLIAEQGGRDVSRESLAEFGSWPRITLPSIKALGLSVRELNGLWGKVAVVPDGRTYVKDGETRESTCFKLLAHYPSEAACRAAYLAGSEADGDSVPDAELPGPPSAPASGNGEDTDQAARETALKFAAAIVKQESGNQTRVAETIAKMPLISRYFTIDSPEIMELCAAEQVAGLSR